MINAPKGTKDVLPADSYKWQYIENIAREVALTFGAKEIRTPVFEHTEVFLRGVGETTDIVNKEMYTFIDKGNRSVTLKPEGTAGIARAFIENGLNNTALPVKTYYITPCFRYERPQSGRLREFHQFGIEFLGSNTADMDAEAILLAKTLFDKLQIKGLKLYINSIGCKTCRKNYQDALKSYLNDNVSKLCPLCRERLQTNPLRILDCKNDECAEITKNAPKILDYICEDCSTHFSKVQSLLTSAGAEFYIDSGIVRGLDYYTKTVFEFVSENLGAKSTVCGGGRYDSLISELGGADVSGVGFALGIERLLLIINSLGIEIEDNTKPTLYLASMGDKEREVAFAIANNLRINGIKTEIDHMERGIKAQFKYADKIGAKYVAVIGSSELEQNAVKVKYMADGTEEIVALDKILEYFKK